jgi:amino-acid N-acetyltransferase
MWFQEQGFLEANIEALPEGKKQLYNYQRNSKVLIKQLED